MNDKTMFLLLFLVSTALLIYVEMTEVENHVSMPECQENVSTHDLTEDCIEPAQDETRSYSYY